jgi:hypothetical protein
MKTKVKTNINPDDYLIERGWKGQITGSSLVLLAFATAFFPRVLDALGFPSPINFLHFVTIPWVCGFVIAKSRTKDYDQFVTSQKILFALGILLTVITASALLNNAGEINAVLSFLLYGEPFIWLLAVTALPFSPNSLKRFHTWLMRFGLINLLFALIQAVVLRVGDSNADNIKGVFIAQGSGHVVSGSISLTFAVYYIAVSKHCPLWGKIFIGLATIIQLVKGDVKQVLAVFLAALLILIIMKTNDIGKLLQYLLGVGLFLGLIVVAANTVFHSLLTWADWDVQREGLALKLSGFSIIPTYYHSSLDWFLGLGPGHTISRLGGWMIREYADLLQPLGVTTSEATNAVWLAVAKSWLGDKSSWFTPLFGWAGIWGDLGFLGLAAYGYLWILVWRRLCQDDLSKFLVLTVIIFGTMLTQIEEPGYMLFMTGIIGLHWHHCHHKEAKSD